MTEDARENLVEELHELLLSVMQTPREALDTAEQRRKNDLHLLELRLLTERSAEQQHFGKRLNVLKGHLLDLRDTVSRLPKSARDRVANQVAVLSELVRQSLDGGPSRPLASEELKRWTIDIRKGHAADKLKS